MRPRTQSEVALLLQALPRDYTVQAKANTALARHERRLDDIYHSTDSPREQIAAINASRAQLVTELRALVLAGGRDTFMPSQSARRKSQPPQNPRA